MKNRCLCTFFTSDFLIVRKNMKMTYLIALMRLFIKIKNDFLGLNVIFRIELNEY